MKIPPNKQPSRSSLRPILAKGRTLLAYVFQLRTLFWLILLVFMLWAFREVSWGEVWRILKRLHTPQILVLLGEDALVLWTFGMQLWVLLYTRGYRIPLLRLVAYWIAGFTVSYFIPGPQLGGGPVQIYFLQKNHPIDTVQATAAVLVSKVLERMGMILVMLIGLVIIAHLALFSTQVTWFVVLLVLLVFGLFAVYLAALYKNHCPGTRLFRMLPARFKDWSGYRWFIDLVANAEGLVGKYANERPDVLFYALLLTILGWVLVITETWLALAFLDIHMSLVEILSIVTVAQMAFLFPTPAGVGAVEASMIFTFQRLGYSPDEGATMALIFRARDLILGSLGLIVGWWQSYPLGRTNGSFNLPEKAGKQQKNVAALTTDQISSLASRTIEAADRRTRKEYDLIADIYDWLIQITAFLDGVQDEQEREKLVRHLDLTGEERVLVVALGTGRNLPYLSESLHSDGYLVGIDLSMAMLEYAVQKGEHLNIGLALVEANAAHLPLASSSFDAVLHFGGINHFAEKQTAVDEIVRVAKKGGKIVISDKSYASMNHPSLRQRLILRLKPWLGDPPPQELVPDGSESVELEWFWNDTAYILSFRK